MNEGDYRSAACLREISDNERKYYSIERAREVLGYDPQDDSADYTLGGEPRDEA